jgi:hypothetical protein
MSEPSPGQDPKLVELDGATRAAATRAMEGRKKFENYRDQILRALKEVLPQNYATTISEIGKSLEQAFEAGKTVGENSEMVLMLSEQMDAFRHMKKRDADQAARDVESLELQRRNAAAMEALVKAVQALDRTRTWPIDTPEAAVSG